MQNFCTSRVKSVPNIPTGDETPRVHRIYKLRYVNRPPKLYLYTKGIGTRTLSLPRVEVLDSSPLVLESDTSALGRIHIITRD